MNENTNEKRSSQISKDPVILCPPEGARGLTSSGRRLVLLVRHGQTDWNAERRLQGREAVPLNDTGRGQSRECGELLCRASQLGLDLGRVFSSPLERAEETARIISSCIGDGEVTVDELLIERDYGAMSGLNAVERRRLHLSGDVGKEAEPVANAAQRIKRAISTIASPMGKSSPVVVTHGGVLNALFYVITSGRIGTGKNISDNCGISLVAAGRDATIPLAFGLTGDGFLSYIEKYLAKKN